MFSGEAGAVVEDTVDIKDHRIQMGYRSARDDGDVVSSDLLHVVNDAW